MIEPSPIEIHRTLALLKLTRTGDVFNVIFDEEILILENSWNHHRVIPGSLLGAPRSPSRLVDLSKLLKSPRISNHEKRRFNVTSNPLLTSFSKMSLCWLHNGQIWDFQSIILLILLVKGSSIWCEALSFTAGWPKPGFQKTTVTHATFDAHFHGSIKCDQDQSLLA